MSDMGNSEPKIIVTATVSSSSLSLSNSHPSPIFLNLTLRLTNSTEPITVFTGDSFLAPVQSSCLNSAYRLIHTASGKYSNAIRTHILVANNLLTINPDTDLVTLYPEIVITAKVRIGMDRYFDGETGVGSAEDLCLCATPLSALRAGETYKVSVSSEMDSAVHVAWWARGNRESIIQERVWWWNRWWGRNSFAVETMSILDPKLRVEMTEQPEINVVD